eukprot:scaffold1204_cov407-Prasinococcus_capsulatus_cf.AAC.1
MGGQSLGSGFGGKASLLSLFPRDEGVGQSWLMKYHPEWWQGRVAGGSSGKLSPLSWASCQLYWGCESGAMTSLISPSRTQLAYDLG